MDGKSWCDCCMKVVTGVYLWDSHCLTCSKIETAALCPACSKEPRGRKCLECSKCKRGTLRRITKSLFPEFKMRKVGD